MANDELTVHRQALFDSFEDPLPLSAMTRIDWDAREEIDRVLFHLADKLSPDATCRAFKLTRTQLQEICHQSQESELIELVIDDSF